MQRESSTRTITVAAVLCLVCSFLVSALAVGLRDRQELNQANEIKKNVLAAAGLWNDDGSTDVNQVFSERVEAKVIDLQTGEYVPSIDAEQFDQRKALSDPKQSEKIPAEEDIAKIKRKENKSVVYLVKGDDGQIEQVVLPVRGYGLWSILWGFFSIDAQTLAESPEKAEVRGITYYEQGETPGLGGEVDNPRWKAKWSNPDSPKQIFDGEWNVQIEVIKGEVSAEDPAREYKVDGLSGATITTNGVSKMLEFWLGPSGFQPFLKRLQNELKSPSGESNGN